MEIHSGPDDGDRAALRGDSQSSVESSPTKRVGRLYSALGPVACGLAIDAVDFVTIGPVGMLAGLLLGGVLGFSMGRMLGLRANWSALAGVLSGLYCAFPPTTVLPVATVIGALARFLNDAPSRAPER